jgi:hypothetical protein
MMHLCYNYFCLKGNCEEGAQEKGFRLQPDLLNFLVLVVGCRLSGVDINCWLCQSKIIVGLVVVGCRV